MCGSCGGAEELASVARPNEQFRVRVFDDKTLCSTWRKLAMLAEGGAEYRELELDRISWK